MICDERLIEEVKEREILYNKSKSGYKNAKLKLEIWEKIAQNLETSSDVCIKLRAHCIRICTNLCDFVRILKKFRQFHQNSHEIAQILMQCARSLKRWRTIRDRFVKEYNKLQAPSGSSMEVELTWNLYDHLLFLRDHVKPRKSTGTNSFNFIIDESPEGLSSSTSDDPEPRKKRGNSFCDITEGLEKAVTSFENFCQQPNASEVQLFMGSIELKIEKMPGHIQNNAMLQIMEYIIKLENFNNGVATVMPTLNQ